MTSSLIFHHPKHNNNNKNAHYTTYKPFNTRASAVNENLMWQYLCMCFPLLGFHHHEYWFWCVNANWPSYTALSAGQPGQWKRRGHWFQLSTGSISQFITAAGKWFSNLKLFSVEPRAVWYVRAWSCRWHTDDGEDIFATRWMLRNNKAKAATLHWHECCRPFLSSFF